MTQLKMVIFQYKIWEECALAGLQHCLVSEVVTNISEERTVFSYRIRFHNEKPVNFALVSKHYCDSARNKMSTRNIFYGREGSRCIGLTNLTTFMRRLS